MNLNTFALSFSAQKSTYVPVLPGQKVYDWPSNGVASNGFSLVRKVLKLNTKLTPWTYIFGLSGTRRRLDKYYPALGTTLGEALLEPTPIWIKQLDIQRREKGVDFAGHAHITGGGLVENIPRILPDNCKVVLDRSSWHRPPIFRIIQEAGGIDLSEMDHVFNQGIMVTSIVSDSGSTLRMPNAFEIGIVEHRQGDEPQVQFTGDFQE